MRDRIITILAVIVVVLGTSSIAYIYYAQWRAELGFDDAKEAYDEGRYRSAFAIFHRMARAGDIDAQRYLTLHFEYGQGTDVDMVAAFHWRLRLADHGDDYSMFWIGHAYEFGTGTGENRPLAFRWYRRAAERGQVDAQAVLGARLVFGRGIAADPEEGLSLLMKAVEAGDTWAMARLGEAHRDGFLGKPDFDVAHRWCLESVRGGSFGGYECMLELLENKQLPTYNLEQAYLWSLVARHWWRDDESKTERLDNVIPVLLRHQPAFPSQRGSLIVGATEHVDGTPGSVDMPETFLEYERRYRDFESWPIRLPEEARLRAESAAEDIITRWPQPPIAEN